MKKFLLFLSLLILGCANSQNLDFNKLRKEMVKTQIKLRGIKDKRVIKAMQKVPRHLLIPEEYRYLAYEDRPVPIGFNQTISQPYIVALMTELLELKGDEKVLEIGTGSGYQAAILAEICKEVYTIEIIEELGRRAEENLKKLGYKNIKVKIGDGFLGWKEFSPFDRIIITCAVPFVPQPLIEQLKEGGKIVLPLGEEFSTQILTVVEKKNGKLTYRDITGVIFVPMTGEEIEKAKKNR
jgi:protein-L-isoaspartate(D-aspartate) O-methyltransferase